MAKSIRSKWKRKMRNVKREKYGKRELETLKQVVAAAEAKKQQNMETDLFTVKTAEDIQKDKQKIENQDMMETDEKKRHPKTLRDEHGQYPVWMNKRAILKKKKTIQKQKRAKKGKKKRK